LQPRPPTYLASIVPRSKPVVTGSTPPYALGSQAELADAIVAVAPDAIITIDATGIITGFNPAAERMFGHARTAALGKQMVELILPPRYRRAHAEGFARAIANGATATGMIAELEVTALRSDGSEFPIELAIASVAHDGDRVFTAFARDISARLRADAALRESERRFRQLTDNIKEVFWLSTASGDRVLHVSAAYAEIWGRSPSEMVGGQTRFIDTVHPDDRARTALALARMADGEDYDIEYRIVHPDGSERWIHDRGFPVRDDAGTIVRIAGIAEDITSRRKAEEARRNSEELFRALTENSGEIVAIMNGDGTSRYLSPSYERILGFPAQDRVGRSVFELTHEDDVASLREAFIRVTSRPGATERLVHRQRDVNGRYRILESTATNLTDHPAVGGVLVTTRDVTERADAERALRESMGRLERITANVPGVVIQLKVQPDGRISFPYVSDAAWTLFGVDPARARDEPSLLLDMIHANDRQQLFEGMSEAVRNLSSWQWEGRVGQVENARWVRGMARPQLQSDSSVIFDAIILDITQERNADEAIRYHAQLLDAVEQAVMATDPDGRVNWWNRYAEQLFGVTSADALGRNIGDLLVPAEDRASFRSTLDQVRTAGKWTGDLQYKRADGEATAVSVTVARTSDAKNEATGYVVVATDASERRSLEERLRQAQKMEAVGRLAGGVAHDCNNLLTVVKLHSELLLETAKPGSAEAEDLEEIRLAAERGASLTRQLLAFSRQQVLEPKVLNLDEVVAELEKMLGRLIGEDIELVTRSTGPAGPVMADPGQIQQVIINLALNARDAMPRGGVVLISTGSVTVSEEDIVAGEGEVRPATPGQFAMLEVRDTGVGMDASTKARIFEPFFTTKPVGEGTGLGLATVHGIVEQSGGFISVDSVQGAGSAFSIYLPLIRPEAEVEREVVSFQAGEQGAETILLVEDEEAVRTLARRILARKGHRIIEASNGREALELVRDRIAEIDLVITDAVMPEMNGPDLAKALQGLRPDLRILFMSGYTDDDILRRGELKRGAGFLHKPFSTDQLARAVRSVLDGE
jgi:two-component system, cell cycle sensor histidine kinase and response regulator CckA